jgi:hypothetical protein
MAIRAQRPGHSSLPSLHSMWGNAWQSPAPITRKGRALNLEALAAAAVKAINKAKGERRYKACRCPGKCECP